MRGPIADVIAQHADGVAALYLVRRVLLASPRARLRDIDRAVDQRIAAHFDGLQVAGDAAGSACLELLSNPSAEAIFVAGVHALESRDITNLERLLAVTAAVPETVDGLRDAFGWVQPSRLPGIVAGLLKSADPVRRRLGIAACTLHRVDPGLLSGQYLSDADDLVRIWALRAAGDLGCESAAPVLHARLGSGNADERYWAARSATLLGAGAEALQTLSDVAIEPGPNHADAFRLSVLALANKRRAHDYLRTLAGDDAQTRRLIEGSGIAGDAGYVPWLISQMHLDPFARASGEAFTIITGADLVELGLDGRSPGDFESGPNETPDDSNVDMDADDGLPWPDVKKVEGWWQANASRFQKGTRYFMGQAVTKEHCIHVLKTGYQRQRSLAAQYLCLLEPGTPLFNTAAPAWRQQRLLAAM